ncbi:DUF2914 domain-containing protein [Patescibacteria group bacterium]|nr:DUF2914 domain-containing protein [Patescibacteria group bacterium]
MHRHGFDSQRWSVVLAATLFVTVTAASPSDARAAGQSAWRKAPEGTLAVTRFALARQVIDRRPDALVLNGRVPLDGAPVYAVIEVFNKGAARDLTMVWRRDGRVMHRYTLTVGRSPGWHTWSLLRATRASRGSWVISVEDASGASLEDQVLVIGE